MLAHNRTWRGRPVRDDATKLAIAKYNEIHTVEQTAIKFGCSPSYVSKIAAQYGDERPDPRDDLVKILQYHGQYIHYRKTKRGYMFYKGDGTYWGILPSLEVFLEKLKNGLKPLKSTIKIILKTQRPARNKKAV
jgi:hypothetical protein